MSRKASKKQTKRRSRKQTKKHGGASFPLFSSKKKGKEESTNMITLEVAIAIINLASDIMKRIQYHKFDLFTYKNKPPISNNDANKKTDNILKSIFDHFLQCIYKYKKNKLSGLNNELNQHLEELNGNISKTTSSNKQSNNLDILRKINIINLLIKFDKMPEKTDEILKKYVKDINGYIGFNTHQYKIKQFETTDLVKLIIDCLIKTDIKENEYMEYSSSILNDFSVVLNKYMLNTKSYDIMATSDPSTRNPLYNNLGERPNNLGGKPYNSLLSTATTPQTNTSTYELPPPQPINSRI